MHLHLNVTDPVKLQKVTISWCQYLL